MYSILTDTPEILDATTITFVLELAYEDCNSKVASFMKSRLDSQFPVIDLRDRLFQLMITYSSSTWSLTARCSKYCLRGIILQNSFLAFRQIWFAFACFQFKYLQLV